jgi:hypothetical protein
MLAVFPIGNEIARQFLDRFHPLGAGGSLRGAKYILGGFEDGRLSFLALLASPRSRWSCYSIHLELSRLAVAPWAAHSASTFLKKVERYLKRQGFKGVIITYAMPGSSGAVYERAGWRPFGRSSGARRSRRGPNGRPTPDTVGSGRRLARFILCVGGGWNKEARYEGDRVAQQG